MLCVGIRERWFEDIIRKTLRRVILVEAHPRTLMQVTLQVIATPREDDVLGGLAQADCVGCFNPKEMDSLGLMPVLQNLPLLPALLQAAMLALLTTSIPLSMTLTSTLLAVDPLGNLIQDPSAQQLREADSVHVLAFSSHGDLLVVESEGEFDLDIWQAVLGKAEQICRGKGKEDGEDKDENMSSGSDEERTLEDNLRDTIREKVAKEQMWKGSLV